MSSTNPSLDRRQLLLSPGAAWNGIDYVEVDPDQTHLRVHFLNTVKVSGTLPAASPVTIAGGEVVTSVAVEAIDEATAWSADDDGRPVLALQVPAPGDFSTYQLCLSSSVVDPFFSCAAFRFKVNCPSDLDCATPDPACPPPGGEPVPISYLAKDFASFRAALSEFSTLRYPGWVERSEADIGMVLMEILAATADELSYYQDRVATESTLPAATQALSVLRHARLVDYEPAPPMVATTVLQLDVAAGVHAIVDPLRFEAVGPGATPISFEVGNGLADPLTGALNPINFPVDARYNREALAPYWWDQSRQCLLAGATSFWLTGHGLGLYDGQNLLLDTAGATSADPPVREVVVLAAPVDPAHTETTDPVLGIDLTLVNLSSPTARDHDLGITTIAGNLVPAVQGVRTTESFIIPVDPPAAQAAGSPPPAIVRHGENFTPDDPVLDYRWSLGSEPLAWVPAPAGDGTDTSVPAQPEVVLLQRGGTPTSPPTPWAWERWLLDAGAAASVFTLTPERYSPVLTSQGITWFDYDGPGTTVRFGNGIFGSSPVPGSIFDLVYRVGAGAAGNVPAGSIARVVPGTGAGDVSACTNPFPATGGADAESISQVRDRAPAGFSARPLRVVRPEDYVAAAKSLPWVRQAGTTFRWTGSWLTVMTAADPVATEVPTVAELMDLTHALNRRRLAGYESYVLPPRYVSVDLAISVCADPAYFAGDIEHAVRAALRPGPLPSGGVGFFDHTRWSFGGPLESSALLATIQSCVGVQGVSQVLYRQRGAQWRMVALPETLHVGPDDILRVDDDPSRPEAGSLTILVNGAK